MNINNKNDVIKWLKRLKDDHPMSTALCHESDKSHIMPPVYTDQVIKNRYQGMIDYLESDEVTSEPSQETIEDTLREDTNERLLYCNTCDEGTPYKDMGYVYGQYCCISCADGMGEKLTSRGCIA